KALHGGGALGHARVGQHQGAGLGLGLVVFDGLQTRLPNAGQKTRVTRQQIARASWENHGGIFIVENWDQACEISNTIAPAPIRTCRSIEIMPWPRTTGRPAASQALVPPSTTRQ
ncbi:MAG: hypothetical protein EBZ44_04590, partial [Verrucomicrobia bacterium]|nr:hypothetical protein [Verrucomicrobiota bacterium]